MRTVNILAPVIGAGLIAFLCWTGREVGVQTERTELIAAIWRHVGYGVVFSPPLLAALAFRLMARNSRSRDLPERTAFWILAAVLLFLTVSGPIVVWTYGSDLKVFDWFVIANPMGKAPAFHRWLEAMHGAVAYAAPWLILLNVETVMTAWRRRKQPNSPAP